MALENKEYNSFVAINHENKKIIVLLNKSPVSSFSDAPVFFSCRKTVSDTGVFYCLLFSKAFISARSAATSLCTSGLGNRANPPIISPCRCVDTWP
jgi:hypothetical protein